MKRLAIILSLFIVAIVVASPLFLLSSLKATPPPSDCFAAITGLQSEMNALQGVTVNGSNQIVSWVDNAPGSTNVVTPVSVAADWTLATNQFGSNPGILGINNSGSLDFLNYSVPITSLTSFDIAIMFNVTSMSVAFQGLFGANQSVGPYFGFFSGLTQADDQSTPSYANFAVFPSTGVNYLWVFDSGTGSPTSSLTVNGVLNNPYSSSGGTWNFNIGRVGSSSGGFNNLVGAVGAMVVYSPALSPTDNAAMVACFHTQGWN